MRLPQWLHDGHYCAKQIVIQFSLLLWIVRVLYGTVEQCERVFHRLASHHRCGSGDFVFSGVQASTLAAPLNAGLGVLLTLS